MSLIHNYSYLWLSQKYILMNIIVTLIISILSFTTFSQEKTGKTLKKGSMYFYWGWNRGAYTKSDITFTGEDYNFTLYNVVADDRQSRFDPAIYFNPKKVTIPQYNMRIGYFIDEKYDVSFGVDHMKYVMRVNQTTTISGDIANSGTAYDGTYDNADFQIKPDFLLYEHTDGLNYLNFELRRNDQLMGYKKMTLNSVLGGGAGMLMPKTNCTLMNNKRHDAFHIAGFGAGIVAGLKVEFNNRFYIMSEVKGSYINMPDVRTTQFKADRAKQHFCFIEADVVFGVNFGQNWEKK